MKWDFITRLKCFWHLLSHRTLQHIGMMLFMKGTYQREWMEEFTKVKDIIIVSQLDVLSDLFIVKRTVVKEFAMNTIPTTQTHEKEEWFAVYDSNTKQLRELNAGRECSFYPEKSLLLVGNNAYQKINQRK